MSASLILHLIFAGFILLAGRAGLVFFWPERRCVRCKGTRVSRHRITKRLTGCPRCKGTSRHYRRGAVLVHRLRWSIQAEIRDMAEERRERRQAARNGL
jgi:hypothetical protein